MRDYLSIYLEQEEEEEEEEGRARKTGGRRSFEVRCTKSGAPCRLACEIRNYRDDSEQLGSSTGREWCMLQRGRGIGRKREGEVKKTELFRGANVCALAEITRTRGGLSFSSSSPPLPLFLSRRLSLLLFFIFSPIRINVLMRSRAETRG